MEYTWPGFDAADTSILCFDLGWCIWSRSMSLLCDWYDWQRMMLWFLNVIGIGLDNRYPARSGLGKTALDIVRTCSISQDISIQITKYLTYPFYPYLPTKNNHQQSQSTKLHFFLRFQVFKYSFGRFVTSGSLWKSWRVKSAERFKSGSRISPW